MRRRLKPSVCLKLLLARWTDRDLVEFFFVFISVLIYFIHKLHQLKYHLILRKLIHYLIIRPKFMKIFDQIKLEGMLEQNLANLLTVCKSVREFYLLYSCGLFLLFLFVFLHLLQCKICYFLQMRRTLCFSFLHFDCHFVHILQKLVNVCIQQSHVYICVT